MKQLGGVKVLLGPSTFGVQDRAPLIYLAGEGCEIIENPYKRRLTKEELLELLSDKVTGLIAGLEPLSRDVLGKTKLKVISRCGSGMSNVDLEAAKDLGIKVYSTPRAPVDAVAELTLGALLSLLRMIPQMDKDLHQGEWKKRIGVQIKGKTVAIVGFGRIGRRVAELLKGFGANVIAVDPNLQENIEGIEVFPLNKALSQADVITVHSSGAGEIIGKDEFELIKKGTFLLNAARGSSVNEEALARALEEGKIKGAWIDTFNCEPYSGLLRKYPQVILTPHVGSYTAECRKSMEIKAVNNLISGLKEIENVA